MTTTAAPVERRASSLKAIKQMVETRTEMLSLFNQLVSQRPFSGISDAAQLLQEFCQSLVDYTAEAHFRLYRYIETRNERRQSIVQIAQQVYPRISDITQHILDFNDKYDTEEHCRDLSALEKDLSVLGEELADRIEQEDKLIAALCRPR